MIVIWTNEFFGRCFDQWTSLLKTEALVKVLFPKYYSLDEKIPKSINLNLKNKHQINWRLSIKIKNTRVNQNKTIEREVTAVKYNKDVANQQSMLTTFTCWIFFVSVPNGLLNGNHSCAIFC